MKKNIRALSAFLAVLFILTGCGQRAVVTAGSAASGSGSKRNEIVLAESSAYPIVDFGIPNAQQMEIKGQQRELDLDDTNTAAAFSWGRDHVDSETRSVYDQVLAAVSAQESEVDIWTDPETLKLAISAILMDHPELYWFAGEANYTSYTDRYIECRLQYNRTPEEVEMLQPQLEAYIDTCLAGIPVYASEYDKVLYVYRYLIANTDYIMTDGDQSCVSVMLQHQGVCAGYARAFQLLMMRLGIPCTFAQGTADGQAHAWNFVEVGSAWYQIDVTWGDPTNPDGMPGAGILYTYCLLTDEEMSRDHTLDSPVEMPECFSKADNYYVHEGLALETWDIQQYGELFRRACETGQDWAYARFDSREAYDEAMHVLFEENVVTTMLSDNGRLPLVGSWVLNYQTDETFFEISVCLKVT